MFPLTWNLLGNAFTVEHLMTPRDQLFSWTNPEDNLPVYDDLPFDVVPVIENGELTGLLNKADCCIEPLSKRWLISRDTSIPELLDYFVLTNQKAFLILHRREVIGLVAPADLNKLPARAYIYNLIAELEMALTAFVQTEYGESGQMILRLLGESRQKEVQDLQLELLEGNADVDILQCLYLSDLINLVEKNAVLRGRLGADSRNSAQRLFSGINEMRKQAMHLVRPLLTNIPGDLMTLQGRIQRSMEIIQRISLLIKKEELTRLV